MKRLILLFMLLASPAWSAVVDHRYVTPTGAGAHTGADLANAFDMDEANAAAAPGVVFHLSNGTYLSGINPQDHGDSTADGSVVYIGNVSNPSLVILPDITVTANFVTIRWLRTTGDLTVENAYKDSLFSVSSAGQVSTSGLIRCYINGGTWDRTSTTAIRHWLASGLTYCYFTDITISHDYSGTGIGETRAWLMDGDVVDSCYFVNIKQTVAVPSGTTFVNEAAWRFFYNIRDTYFIGCKLTVDDDQSGGFALGVRGSTALHKNVHYVRDTILDVGSSTSGSRIAVSGNEPINDLFFDECVYYLGRKIHTNWGSSRWSFFKCILVFNNLTGSEVGSGANMFENSDFPLNRNSTDLAFNHCTIYYRRNDATDNLFSTQTNTSSNRITNSVVMVRQTRSPINDPSCTAQRVFSVASGADVDSNVYYRVGGSAADSNMAMSQGGGCLSASATASRWGGAALNQVVTDTTWNPGSITGPKPDLRPMPQGVIIHTRWPDGYVGAIGPASATQPAAVDSFYAAPQHPRDPVTNRIAGVLTWYRPAEGTSTGDTTLYIRMYPKNQSQILLPSEAAWWDSARVVGHYPFSYREFRGPDGWIVLSPDDSVGFSNTREVGGSDDLYTTPSGNVDGAVNATDLWFGIRYRVGNGPLSPTRYAFFDGDSSIRIYSSATPPPGAVNVGQNVGGTVIWWYKPNGATSYQMRLATGLISESNWSTATPVFMNPISGYTAQPAGTIHYARVQAPCGGTYSVGLKYTNAAFTGDPSNLSSISGPIIVTCGN